MNKLLKKITFIVLLTSISCANSQCFLQSTGKFQNYNLYDKINDSFINKKYDEGAKIFSRILDLRVKYGYYDDFDGNNAFAINSSRSMYDGETYFGKNLLRSFKGKQKALNMLLVSAHEFAHIFQFKNNQRATRVKWQELQADYIAGAIFAWYFIADNGGIKTKSDYDLLDKFREFAGGLFYSLGDNDFTNPQHHGTPSQREESFDNGFRHQIADYLNMKDNNQLLVIDKDKLWSDALLWKKIIKKNYRG